MSTPGRMVWSSNLAGHGEIGTRLNARGPGLLISRPSRIGGSRGRSTTTVPRNLEVLDERLAVLLGSGDRLY